MNTLVMFIAVILLGASVAVYIRSRHMAAGSYRMIFALYAGITVAAAVAVRLVQKQYPQDLVSGAILKFCASFPSVLYALR